MTTPLPGIRPREQRWLDLGYALTRLERLVRAVEEFDRSGEQPHHSYHRRMAELQTQIDKEINRITAERLLRDLIQLQQADGMITRLAVGQPCQRT